MPMTMTEKILARAAGRADVKPGDNVWVDVDVLMTHDVCGPGTIGIFKEQFGAEKALGYLIGQKLVDKVPVLEHHDFSRIELKNMGGAMAASGGVALFHVEGITPEAPDLKSVFDGNPEGTITVTQEDLDALRTNQPQRAGTVVFGCPQMTYEEACDLAVRFQGKKTKKRTWFCMIPDHLERFSKTDLYHGICDAGVECYSHCPLAALSVRLGGTVLTPSGKLYYYLADTDYGTIDDCLRACGVM